MSPKEIILGRVREALRIAAPRRHEEQADPGHEPREWLPSAEGDFEDLSRLFATNAEALTATYHVCASHADVVGLIKEIARTENWSRLALHRDELLDPIAADLGVPLFYTDAGYSADELEQCEAGLTTCEALVAQTGSILVTSRTNGGRALSVLPPHHIVIARKIQMLPDLPAAFSLLRERFDGNLPSCLSFITGPSRTGDIERILVLGAHGPKRLTIFVTG